jgi:hypothetical protein
MTAQEWLQSSEPKTVGQYMDALREVNELLMLAMKAHRHCARVRPDLTPKYHAFLAARRSYAVGELLEHVEEAHYDSSLSAESILKVTIPVHVALSKQTENLDADVELRGIVTFTKHPTEGWKSSPANEAVLCGLCDLATGENTHGKA